MGKNPSNSSTDQNASTDNNVSDLDRAKSTVTDACPKWAALLIDEIRALEIRLGNIRTTDTEAGAWQKAKLSEVLSRVDDDAHSFDESVVEAHFRRISARLLGEGFTAAQIATFINSRIPTGGRLAYCNADEVSEAARHAPTSDD